MNCSNRTSLWKPRISTQTLSDTVLSTKKMPRRTRSIQLFWQTGLLLLTRDISHNGIYFHYRFTFGQRQQKNRYGLSVPYRKTFEWIPNAICGNIIFVSLENVFKQSSCTLSKFSQPYGSLRQTRMCITEQRLSFWVKDPSVAQT